MKFNIFNRSGRKPKRYERRWNKTGMLSCIGSIILFLSICCMAGTTSGSGTQQNAEIAFIERTRQIKQVEAEYKLFEDSITTLKDSINITKRKLEQEVDRYMRRYHPKTKMSSRLITELCLEKDFDIPLLLSQARLESVFGKRTGGTNSCFGVVSRRYTHVNHSITDYVKIMQKSYVRTRTAEECIRAGFNVEGSRKYKYAEDPTYSKTISAIRSNIIKTTDIADYVDQIHELSLSVDSMEQLKETHPGAKTNYYGSKKDSAAVIG